MNDVNRVVERAFVPPPNLIAADSEFITPPMLPLLEIEQRHIDAIVRTVTGGAANVQDIYPLSPAQEGVLFHSLLNKQGDAYLLSTLFELQSRAQLDALIDAVQRVVDRHDVLRSAVLWEDLPRPVQVVYRKAMLPVDEIAIDANCDAVAQLRGRMIPDSRVIDLRRAPLARLEVVAGDGGRWHALLQLHHLVCDDLSWRAALSEVLACVEHRDQSLPVPVAYRNYVAQALEHARCDGAQAFFRSKLADVDEPTAPFGLLDVHGDGRHTREAVEAIEPELAQRIRAQARHLGLSPARLFHAGWGLVVAHTSGRDDVVYGTVLLVMRQASIREQRMLGICINTLPLRLQLNGVTAMDLVFQTHRELSALLQYRHAPLTLVQQCSGLTSTVPLFTALLNYRHRESDRSNELTDPGRPLVLAQRGARTNYPVTISVDDLGQGFELVAQTDQHVDPKRVAQYLHTAMRSLLDALEHEPQTPALSLPILPPHERSQVIEAFNATQASYPGEKLLHELFERQVELTPQAPAVVHAGQTVTYRDLNRHANQLAHYLRELGTQSGEYVPVHMSRSLLMLIAQLALLKVGAVYVPIDPETPAERRSFMIRDCRAQRVLADAECPLDLRIDGMPWLDCSALGDVLAKQSAGNLQLSMSSVPAAYVMYTSGSTGVPKGVVVPQHAVSRLAINNGYAQIGSDDCIAHHSNPTFDASTFEIWAALLVGARVLIVPQAVVLEMAQFSELLKEQRVTILYMSVGLFNQYVDACTDMFAGLRYLIVGGDSLKPGTIRRVLSEHPPQHLLNGYGPTEGTTFATTHLIKSVDQDAKSIPIGRPMANAQIYIINTRGQVVPIGVTGEIYIGGAGVACGYLNRPELTMERFVADPFDSDPRARLYRTGDLGYWRPDGTIEFLGRNDQQVKIRGFRVELGEIEAQLHDHYRVGDVAVIAYDNGSDEKRLVAYVVPKDGEGHGAAPSAEELRAHLRAALPEYMVPTAIVMMERLPLTPNGKLDRRALPRPALEACRTQPYEAPRGPTEEGLAAIWQQVLRVERVGRLDNFFALGGHSLLATQVVTRLRAAFVIEPSIKLLFEFPTLEGLAARIDDLRRVHIAQRLAAGDDAMTELLAQVASMPDSHVRELLGGLTTEGRP